MTFIQDLISERYFPSPAGLGIAADDLEGLLSTVDPRNTTLCNALSRMNVDELMSVIASADWAPHGASEFLAYSVVAWRTIKLLINGHGVGLDNVISVAVAARSFSLPMMLYWSESVTRIPMIGEVLEECVCLYEKHRCAWSNPRLIQLNAHLSESQKQRLRNAYRSLNILNGSYYELLDISSS